MTGLDPATDYEYQACARNWTGWTYGNTVAFKTAALPKPVVGSVSPSSGPAGTRITIKGGNFGAAQGASRVTVGGVEAAALSWSDTGIAVAAPGGTKGGAVVVTTEAGASNADRTFTVTETADTTWYLAEGTNAWGFSTYITLVNPNEEEVSAKLTYLDPNPPASGKGVAATRTVTLPPGSQTTVSSEPDISAVDFSTKVESAGGKPIAVDRTMFWTGEGCSGNQAGYHTSIGVTAPSETWYLPEGSSNWGFETWTLVENPNNRQANVELTYMTIESGPRLARHVVPPNSRATFSMLEDIGAADASIRVASDIPVVAERSMYRDGKREGSCSIGATAPSKDFFLAEGATGYDVGFVTYVLVQNPSGAPNEVNLSFQTDNGEVEGPVFTMPPNSRMNVRLNDHLPEGSNVSTTVRGSRPLVAERAMFWNNGTGEAFHASIGLDSARMAFMLPDGQSGNGCETWTLVANPNPGAVTVRITYLPQNGGKAVSFTDEVAPGARATYAMRDKVPSGRASILVESLDGARPVMVERSMYWNNRAGGSDTIGIPL